MRPTRFHPPDQPQPDPMKGAAAGQRLGMLVMEPSSLVMERKMLLGIKRREAACRGAVLRAAPKELRLAH
jgi:hypothetical protein